jgi:hypothetical protein
MSDHDDVFELIRSIQRAGFSTCWEAPQPGESMHIITAMQEGKTWSVSGEDATKAVRKLLELLGIQAG